MPGIVKTRAIVTKTTRHGESDLVVSFLTEEHGLVKGYARGAVKSKKRFAGCFEPFTLLSVTLRFKASAGLAGIDSADILDAHYGIREDLDRINAGDVMLRFASMMEPGAGFAEPFLFMRDTLKVLERAKDPVALCAVFVVKFLLMGGYGIPHESCSRCGAGITGQPTVYIGGFALLCARCGSSMGGAKVSPGTLAFVRQAETLEPAKMGRLVISTGTKDELYVLLGGFASSAAGKRLEYLEIFKPSVRKPLT